MRVLAVIALLVGACSFTPGALGTLTDAAPDGPPPITVGFAKTTTETDENVPLTQVRVLLSKPSDQAITVSFAVTGGTADRPNDYLLSDGVLTFDAGDVEETIDITVGADATAEPDETIDLSLSNVTGAGAVLINSMHTVTISANTLPRVTFSLPTSAADETVSPTIDVVLDKPSLLTTNVDITVMSGSATGGGTDYTLVTTTVTFDPGEVTQPVTLTVVNDTLDEPNEDVTLQLTDPTNIVVGTASTRAHTINDEDDAPTVEFDVTSSTVAEGGTMIDLAISLSAASGKNVNIPFSINTSTAANTDYSVVTASPIAFNAGTVTQNLRVNIVQDTLVEPSETIVLMLGTPNPSQNATLGTNITHTVTITDDDSSCLGTGNFALCFPTPTAAVNVSGAFNTDTSPQCATAAPLSGWTGGPSSCFVVGTNITVAATQVTGSKPLVLFASGTITVSGDLDVASHRGGTAGPGTNQGCGTYTDFPLDSTSGGGGGAGGTFRTAGGIGGDGNSANDSGGAPVAADTGAPTILRGGCIGQKGGNGSGGTPSNGGDPGAGGGAVYLVAGGALTINTGVTINASGAGADALTGFFGGGGGGGSGGMIKLHAASFTVTGAKLMANGGGGSSGADNDTAGLDGSDPTTLLPTAGGAFGPGGSGRASGGVGFGTATTTGNGANGNSNTAGGGGGGGGGYIVSNIALTGAAAVSAGDIDP